MQDDWAVEAAQKVLGPMADSLLVGDVAAALRAERAKTAEQIHKHLSESGDQYWRDGYESIADEVRREADWVCREFGLKEKP